MKTKKLIMIIVTTLEILFLLWILASWFNILAHNTLGDETYTYWEYNFFQVLVNIGNKIHNL